MLRPKGAFDFKGGIGFLLGAGVICNVLPDYLSLVVNKYFEERITSSSRIYDVLTLVLASTLITSAIAVTLPILIYAYAASSLTIHGLVPTVIEHPTKIPGLSWVLLRLFWGHILPFKTVGCVFVYASFLPCVWLYVSAALLVKAISRVRTALGAVAPVLDLQSNPFSALGKVAGAVTFVFWGLVVLAVKTL
jgi:hypothetical protein